MLKKLFGRKQPELSSVMIMEEPFDMGISRQVVESLVEFRASGKMPEVPWHQACLALLMTKSKKEALKVARAHPPLLQTGMTLNVVKSAYIRGEVELAKDFYKRRGWISELDPFSL